MAQFDAPWVKLSPNNIFYLKWHTNFFAPLHLLCHQIALCQSDFPSLSFPQYRVVPHCMQSLLIFHFSFVFVSNFADVKNNFRHVYTCICALNAFEHLWKCMCKCYIRGAWGPTFSIETSYFTHHPDSCVSITTHPCAQLLTIISPLCFWGPGFHFTRGRFIVQNCVHDPQTEMNIMIQIDKSSFIHFYISVVMDNSFDTAKCRW